ncbi:hypothetical protein SAMN05444487_10630 [Marininema mesophilum]|uniref:Uncharacterized protein n=1 Tax=Marininema mesophilum TaxID=1048340 RepID=A0A1H2W6M1_9BACL|nr:hypothetical protein [Marininema mesophilum]SDW76096.1 hypothetical protein SAMN05444487_10630 [Marininema mesophilum]
MREGKIQRLLTILFSSWSAKTSSLYTPDNPAKGQCGVTALVVQDLLAGEIVKTRVAEGWQYNMIISNKPLKKLGLKRRGPKGNTDLGLFVWDVHHKVSLNINFYVWTTPQGHVIFQM